MKTEICLEDTYHVFQEPENVTGDPALFRLSQVERNTRSGDFELTYKTNGQLRENLRGLDGASSKYLGHELPTRNHLLALQRLPDGRMRVVPVTSVVKFSKVFSNDVKQKVVGKEESANRVRAMGEANKVQFRVLSEENGSTI